MARGGKAVWVGVDLGGTNIGAGVVGASGKVVSRAKMKTRADEGTMAVVRRVAETVRDAASDAGLKVKDLQAVGIGAPGTVDIDKGMVVRAVNLRWNKVLLGGLLKKELDGVPVVVENDVNVAAWGEFATGNAKKDRDMLAVWVGTGIGGGLVLGGQLFRGHHLTAGEIGHTIIHADAALGRRTLENNASRTAVVNLLTQLISANHESKITQIVGGDFSSIRSRVIAKALQMDDPLTRQVLQQAAKYVGVAIANSVTMLSLPCVVLGGGVTDSLGQPWVQWVQEAFEEYVFPLELRSCRIVASRLGDDAGIVGAALLAKERLWKSR